MNFSLEQLVAMSPEQLDDILRFLVVRTDGDRKDKIKRIRAIQKLTAPWVMEDYNGTLSVESE